MKTLISENVKQILAEAKRREKEFKRQIGHSGGFSLSNHVDSLQDDKEWKNKFSKKEFKAAMKISDN